MEAKHGNWTVSPWSGGEKHPSGFYVSRIAADGRTEWVRSSQNPSKARRFKAEASAIAYAARINGRTA